MRRTHHNTRKAIVAVALSFAALAAFTGTAWAGDNAASPSNGSVIAEVPSDYTADWLGMTALQVPEIPYLSHGQGVDAAAFAGVAGSAIEPTPGGVTHPNPVKLYELQHAGVAQPDGYQPQLRGDEPLVIRDAPDGFVPRTPEPVAVSASSDGFDRDDVAIGFGLGLILATACAAALAAASGRGRGRMAHS